MGAAVVMTQVTDIVIKGNDLKVGQDRRTYQVWLGGEMILPYSFDPEHDACRVLSARGIKGKLRSRWDGKGPGVVMGIEQGAARKTTDSRRHLRVGEYSPHPMADSDDRVVVQDG